MEPSDPPGTDPPETRRREPGDGRRAAPRFPRLMPPPGYRGGKAAFLAHVSESAGSSRREFSSLDVDLAWLYKVFRLYPWVSKVLSVERGGPKGVVVRLEYREPVAVEFLSRSAWGT